MDIGINEVSLILRIGLLGFGALIDETRPRKQVPAGHGNNQGNNSSQQEQYAEPKGERKASGRPTMPARLHIHRQRPLLLLGYRGVLSQDRYQSQTEQIGEQRQRFFFRAPHNPRQIPYGMFPIRQQQQRPMRS
jgi:hypothetical protein